MIGPSSQTERRITMTAETAQKTVDIRFGKHPERPDPSAGFELESWSYGDRGMLGSYPCPPGEAEFLTLYDRPPSGGTGFKADLSSPRDFFRLRRYLDGKSRSALLIERTGGLSTVSLVRGQPVAIFIDWDLVKPGTNEEYTRSLIAEVEAAPIERRRKDVLLEDLKLFRLRAAMRTVA
jgi:hypothetical protein